MISIVGSGAAARGGPAFDWAKTCSNINMSMYVFTANRSAISIALSNWKLSDDA